MEAKPRFGVPVEAADEGEYIYSASEIFGVVRRRLWIIGLTVVVLAGLAVGASLAQSPMYEGTIEILVGQGSGITEAPNEAAGLQQITKTMTKGINSLPVAQAVIEQQNLQLTPEEFLEEHLSVEQVPDTQFIEVRYRDTSPEQARQVANAVGDAFSEQISQASPSARSITAAVWQQAAIPDEPVSPNPVRNGLLALVVGLVLGVGLALLLEYLDDSWRSSEEVERVSGVPTFVVIPEYGALEGKAEGGGR